MSDPIGRPLELLPEVSQGPGKLEAVLRGVSQGGTLGWGDEIAGAAKAAANAPADWLWNKLHPDAQQASKSAAEHYREGRDVNRAANAAAEAAHPGYYRTAEAVATLVPDIAATAATGGAALPFLAAGQGAIQGAGYSDADDLGVVARDAGVGAGLGLASFGVGTRLGKASQRLAEAARKRVGAAQARAAEQAAQEVAKKLASAKGELGTETQRGSRYIENLMRLEESMTPEQKAVYAHLQKSGVVPDLQQSVAQGTLEALPAQAGTIAGKREAFDALAGATDQDIASRTKELLEPTFGADAKSLFRSYGEPIIGAAIGTAVGKEAGELTGSPGVGAAIGGIGGLAMGRTRMGKAIRLRFDRPGNQQAIWSALQRTAETNPQALGRFGAVLQRAAASGPQGFAAAHYLLSQKDPEYRQLTMSAEEAPAE